MTSREFPFSIGDTLLDLAFYVGAGDLNSRPHSCAAHALPMAPSLHPRLLDFEDYDVYMVEVPSCEEKSKTKALESVQPSLHWGRY